MLKSIYDDNVVTILLTSGMDDLKAEMNLLMTSNCQEELLPQKKTNILKDTKIVC
jgi:hypothetical protein